MENPYKRPRGRPRIKKPAKRKPSRRELVLALKIRLHKLGLLRGYIQDYDRRIVDINYNFLMREADIIIGQLRARFPTSFH
jgi:hypothetical protein